MEIVSWVSIAAALASLFSIAAFWMKMGGKLERAMTAVESVNDAHTRIDNVVLDLGNFKVEADRCFSTKENVAESERRVASALDGVKHELDRMRERFDRLLERLSQEK